MPTCIMYYTEQLTAAAISRRPRPASYIPTIRFLNSGVVSCTPLVLPILATKRRRQRCGDLNRTRRVTYAKKCRPRDKSASESRRFPFKLSSFSQCSRPAVRSRASIHGEVVIRARRASNSRNLFSKSTRRRASSLSHCRHRGVVETSPGRPRGSLNSAVARLPPDPRFVECSGAHHTRVHNPFPRRRNAPLHATARGREEQYNCGQYNCRRRRRCSVQSVEILLSPLDASSRSRCFTYTTTSRRRQASREKHRGGAPSSRVMGIFARRLRRKSKIE